MNKSEYKVLGVPLSNGIISRLEKLAKEERRSVSEQAALIIYNYFSDIDKVQKLANKGDFGTITEDKLRRFLKKEENQIEYKYEDIENLSFDQLFQFWIDNFFKR